MTDAEAVAAITFRAAVISASLAAVVAVLCVYLTQFVAENFRRFKDGSALAASLHGELSSYRLGYDTLRGGLENWAQASRGGQKDVLVFRPVDLGADVVFDSAVPRIGLLGIELVGDTVYLYSQLKAIRIAVGILYSDHKDMKQVEFEMRCDLTVEALDKLKVKADELAPRLLARANSKFGRGTVVKP